MKNWSQRNFGLEDFVKKKFVKKMVQKEVSQKKFPIKTNMLVYQKCWSKNFGPKKIFYKNFGHMKSLVAKIVC